MVRPPRASRSPSGARSVISGRDPLKSLNPTQKRALCDILTALTESPQDDNDEGDVFNVDDQFQISGAEAYEKFETTLRELNDKFEDLMAAAQQLGSSAAILATTFHLCLHLKAMIKAFRRNAARIFPQTVPQALQEPFIISDHRPERYRASKHDPGDSRNPAEHMRKLTDDMRKLLQHVRDFPEYTSGALTVSISSFITWLKYRGDCLELYTNRFQEVAIQSYIHDLSSEMGEHMNDIRLTLSAFIEKGIPTIRCAEEKHTMRLQNLSTIAVFLSGVTISALGIAYAENERTSLIYFMSSFWFVSLVFSIATAINSVVAITWKQSMYRSPFRRLHKSIGIWIRHSTMAFLVISVLCFSLGLVCLAFQSQRHITSIVTTTLTTFTSISLTAVLLWFGYEKWIFFIYHGRKWPLDVDLAQAFMVRKELAEKAAPFGQYPSSVASSVAMSPTILSTNNPLPATTSHAKEIPGSIQTRRKYSHYKSNSDNAGIPIVISPSSNLLDARLWRSRFERLQPIRAFQVDADHVNQILFSPDRKFLAASFNGWPFIFSVQDILRATKVEPFSSQSPSTMNPLWEGQVSWLLDENLDTGNMLLAKSGCTIHLWKEGSPSNFLSLPDGSQDPPTRNTWETITRPKAVQAAIWLPWGTSFLSIEGRDDLYREEENNCIQGSDIIKLDLNGEVLDTHPFQDLKIQDVAVIPDGCHILVVGQSLRGYPFDDEPSNCKVENQVILYNMEKKRIRQYVPVFHDVRGVYISKYTTSPDTIAALVSYIKAPPQLWKIKLGLPYRLPELLLRRTYLTKGHIDFAGMSSFGGNHDDFVVSAGRGGDIYIWDRFSGDLLCNFKAPAKRSNLTSIASLAGNETASIPFILATGRTNGYINIWMEHDISTQDEPRQEDVP